MPTKRNKGLTFTQMFRVRDRHELEARALACTLVSGDPFLADEVTRAVFRALVGQSVGTERQRSILLSAQRLPRTLWVDIAYACAARMGDRGIVDLAKHLWRKHCEENRATRRARAAAHRLPENVILLRSPVERALNAMEDEEAGDW
ncbi:MAG TPA: hypothetical protein VGG39_15850 [Polyangiaceae bacterium]|jgi:hypothetical protein